jgi:hypothetical protein
MKTVSNTAPRQVITCCVQFNGALVQQHYIHTDIMFNITYKLTVAHLYLHSAHRIFCNGVPVTLCFQYMCL